MFDDNRNNASGSIPQKRGYYSSRVTAAFGQRGTGKTTWLIREIENNVPFILIDPMYDPKLSSLGLYQVKSMREALTIFKEGNPQRLYITPDLEQFDFFCGIALAHGGITLIIDEVDSYSNTHYLPRNFRKVIKYGRHRGVNVIAIARRPKEMNLLIRSQANRFIIFPMGGEDAKDLEEYIGHVYRNILELKVDSKGSEYIEYTFYNKSYVKSSLSYVLTNECQPSTL